MRIFVKAKPSSREEKVERTDEDTFTVSVKEAPVRGAANKAIIKALARFLKIPEFRMTIISGETSGHKIIEISKN